MEQPWQDQIIKRKESGKDELTVKDMAAISGADETFIRTMLKHRRIQPMHYHKTYAVDGVVLDSESQKKVEANAMALEEKTKGVVAIDKKKRIRDMATSMVINDARIEGRPVHFKYREKPAEEVFKNRMDSPFGKDLFKNPKFQRETKNIESGGTWDEGPQGSVSMPDNYDGVLWKTRSEQAARCQVLWEATGDRKAFEEYNKIRNALNDPSLLPELEARPEKLTAKEKILKD